MKYIIIFITLLMGLSFNTSAQSNKDKDQFEVKVDGLGCAFCAYGLEKTFKEIKGLKDIKIELETGVFTFTMPSSNPLTVDQVEKQVKDAGYTAVNTLITRSDGSIEKNDGPAEENINDLQKDQEEQQIDEEDQEEKQIEEKDQEEQQIDQEKQQIDEEKEKP